MKNPYEPIFKEIAKGLLSICEFKPNFSNKCFLDVILIFQTALMDKVYENQNYDNMPFEQRFEMVKKCGEDLRKLIHTYTNLDIHKLAKL